MLWIATSVVILAILFTGCQNSAKVITHNHNNTASVSCSVGDINKGEVDDFTISPNSTHESKFKWAWGRGPSLSVTMAGEASNGYPYFNTTLLKDGESIDWHLENSGYLTTTGEDSTSDSDDLVGP